MEKQTNKQTTKTMWTKMASEEKSQGVDKTVRSELMMMIPNPHLQEYLIPPFFPLKPPLLTKIFRLGFGRNQILSCPRLPGFWFSNFPPTFLWVLIFFFLSWNQQGWFGNEHTVLRIVLWESCHTEQKKVSRWQLLRGWIEMRTTFLTALCRRMWQLSCSYKTLWIQRCGWFAMSPYWWQLVRNVHLPHRWLCEVFTNRVASGPRWQLMNK